MKKSSRPSQERILDAACKTFASNGYEGASIQEIVTLAKVTKPTLYYYFKNKEGLYEALVDRAQDERFRLMQEAVAKHKTVKEQLIELLDVLFKFARDHRDFTRVCFSTAFASQKEVPSLTLRRQLQKRRRNLEFIHSLIKQGISSGELDKQFESRDLATAISAQFLFYAMSQALHPKHTLKRLTAKRVVEIYLKGAARKKNS